MTNHLWIVGKNGSIFKMERNAYKVKRRPTESCTMATKYDLYIDDECIESYDSKEEINSALIRISSALVNSVAVVRLDYPVNMH